jgi:hypothetical protein
MADTQGLFDALAGIGGANINRPQLNAYVANSQAINGLRSAQTEDALLKAQELTEQATAKSQLRENIGKLFGPNDQSKADAATNLMIAGLGNAKDAADAVGKFGLGNTSTMGQPTQTADQQMVQGKIAPLESVPNNFAVAPGAPQPNVQQSPQGAAQTADVQSQTALRNAQTAAGGFNPHAGGQGGPLDPAMVDFGGYMLYKTGKMPAMGMGGGAARSAIIAHAAQLSQAEANGQPITNQGYDTAISNGQDYTAAGRALGGFAGGPLGNQTRSINNVVGHLQLMENLFSGLQNGDTQIANKVGNAWTKAFGSPVPTDIQTASSFIGPELTKILSSNGSTGTAEERQEFANTAANLANSPEQTAGAINTLKGMLGRQMTDMALQYHGATGRSDFASRYVAPDVAQYLDIAPQNAPALQPGPTPAPGGASSTPAAPAQPAAPVQIRNDDDYNKLPSGALFIGPDGHTRRKQ